MGDILGIFFFLWSQSSFQLSFVPFLSVPRRVSEVSSEMERTAVSLIFLIALGTGQILRLPSSYKNGVKWEFGTNVFRDDTLARSSVARGPVAPIVYEKEPVAPIARKEPAVATVYKKLPAVPDVYTKKSVVPTVYQKEPIVQSARKRQSAVVPAVFETQPGALNIYKSQPVVRNVYSQRPPVSTVHKTYPVVSNIYKSQPIRPTVHHQDHRYFLVPKVPVGAQKRTEHHVWNQYNPHRSFGNAHASRN
nr:PREDICTED: uncharacterized protein LOC105668683 [Linepithema humile]